MKKKISVSEGVWRQLDSLKGAGETYDQLLRRMIQEHNRMKLFEKMERALKERDFVPLEEI